MARSAAGRSSTTRPAYITITRSQTSPTTVTSWLISTSATSSASRIAVSRSSTCCCTVTSSAVVGSSATISDGLPIRPMPIIARWRIPPENSCGYCLTRVAASGMRTAVSRSTARAVASRRVMPWWWVATSASWAPMRRVGLNEVIGSWNTMASEVPSIRRRTAVSGASRSVPSRSSRVASTRPWSATSRVIASAVMDLPDPDSPTMPTASPRRTSKETPRTSRTGPAGPGKVTSRSRTSSTTSDDGSGTSSSSCAAASGSAATTARVVATVRRPTPTETPSPFATDSPKRLNASPATRTAAPGVSAAAAFT